LAEEMDKFKNQISQSPGPNIAVQLAIQKNYAKAEIFFQTLNVVSIEQSPLMDVS
jgi:hypothetical protein